MVALDSEGKTIGVGNVKAQTRAVLEAIEAVLDSAGGKMSDITFNTIILKDFADYKAMNEVYAEYFQRIRRRDIALRQASSVKSSWLRSHRSRMCSSWAPPDMSALCQ